MSGIVPTAVASPTVVSSQLPDSNDTVAHPEFVHMFCRVIGIYESATIPPYRVTLITFPMGGIIISWW
ncbi:MAG: hypothetical protein KME05_00420 [Gloeocapsa sp. UFS-A4-WI-NPMV-4B04]|nr:hypothetical protein [Gloeocapsa sp. UFS-A4-WI-NPMV-4B04]